MKTLIAIALFALASIALTAKAEDGRPPEKYPNTNWTARDSLLEGVFGLTMLGDIDTTDQFTRHPTHGHYALREANPVLGHHPSTPELVGYGTVCLAAHAVVARMLPPPYRLIWQATWITGEGVTTTRNLSLGAKFEF